MHLTSNEPMETLWESENIEMLFDAHYRRGQIILKMPGRIEGSGKDAMPLYGWLNADGDGADILMYQNDAFKRDIQAEPLTRVFLEFHKRALQILVWPYKVVDGPGVDGDPLQVLRLMGPRQFTMELGRQRTAAPRKWQEGTIQSLLDTGGLSVLRDEQFQRGQVIFEMRDQAREGSEERLYGWLNADGGGVDVLVYGKDDFKRNINVAPVARVLLKICENTLRVDAWSYAMNVDSAPLKVVPLVDLGLLV